jgi:hypothetical protein
VCRNCGLPVASTNDPLRGVAPGRIDMPSSQRSGLSATIGLVLVVGLLLVAGTLAVSGGGILNSGGRLGVDPVESASAPPADTSGDLADRTQVDPEVITDAEDSSGGSTAGLGTKFDYTCDAGAIKDLSRRKWFLSQFSAGSRIDDGYDQVTWSLTRQSTAKARKAAVARMEWLTPSEARSKYGALGKVQGSRALVVTFDGPVDINANQTLDSLLLEREDVDQIKNIQMFEGSDGNVHTIVGLRSDSCARLEARGWSKNSKLKNARVLLQVERFE